MEGWMNIKEKLPEFNKFILVYCPDRPHKKCDVGILKKIDVKGTHFQTRLDDSKSIDNVTHWMPLPEPPEEE